MGKRKTIKINQKEAARITRRIHKSTRHEIMEEFKSLQNLSCTEAKSASGRTHLGNNIVDAFTLIERIHAKGDQNVSFYEFWKQRSEFKKKPYVKKMLDFYKTRDIDEIRKLKYIYNLYFSSIAIFRPIMAIEVYCRVKASRVLDFTMGWGGRLVGACALNLEAYYGIDLNTHLKTPYTKMVNMLKSDSSVKTDIDLQFKDALEVDYSKMKYDTVLTSPPYYATERYRTKKTNHPQTQYTKLDWNTKFYVPLLTKTYKHLSKGGRYCVNVPETIYKDVCVKVLGKCHEKILLKKGKRSANEKYKEYVYVWMKQ